MKFFSRKISTQSNQGKAKTKYIRRVTPSKKGGFAQRSNLSPLPKEAGFDTPLRVLAGLSFAGC